MLREIATEERLPLLLRLPQQPRLGHGLNYSAAAAAAAEEAAATAALLLALSLPIVRAPRLD